MTKTLFSTKQDLKTVKPHNTIQQSIRHRSRSTSSSSSTTTSVSNMSHIAGTQLDESNDERLLDDDDNEILSDHYDDDHLNDLKLYFDRILFENTNNTNSDLCETTNLGQFFCVCCRLRFETNKDFLKHCNSDLTLSIHKKFKLNKEQEKFINDNLIINKNNGSKIENKIIIFLMDKLMKLKFLDKFAQDLLVANEETALCLEELNNETKKPKISFNKPTTKSDNESEEDDYIQDLSESEEKFNQSDSDEISNNKQNYSLLFIDYSIIQFSRIIKNLKNLYCDSVRMSSYESSSRSSSTSSDQSNRNHSYSSPVINSKDSMSILGYDSTNNVKMNKKLLKFKTDSQKLSQSNENELINLKLDNALKQLSENSNQIKHKSNKPTSNFIASPTSLVKNKQISPPPVQLASSSTTATTSTMHSRNACKKLKCPKCNWHYKYRETLDIHMREKHSSDLTNTMSQQCTYCIENSQHPRLGRGEQYKCGYKPYRCDICDYSTTTKGNLSIHMQSDKHINNLKETKTTTSSSNSSSNSSSPLIKTSTSATTKQSDDLNESSENTDNKQLILMSLNNSNKNETNKDQLDQFNCNMCNFETDNKKSLQSHKQSIHCQTNKNGKNNGN